MPTYLITGSNRGIGLELCRQIHKRGDNVIATCRKASKELRDLGVRVEENVEISSDESITNLCKKLSGVNLDCLIHNAGIYEFNSLENFDKKSISMIFLDTIHTYEQVLAEFKLWEPYMKDDCVMLIDDIRPSMPGRTKWRFHTELDYTYKYDVTEWAHNDTGYGVYLK